MSHGDVPPLEGSELALSVLRVDPEQRSRVEDAECDSLLYVFEGAGGLELDGSRPLVPGAAALVLARERAELEPGEAGLGVIRVTVGPRADRHAPLGVREAVAELPDSWQATGMRSFQVLFGPHNGSSRATMFLGFIPPGTAPWHYHLYDEIVWVPEGPGNLHVDGKVEALAPGSAFRLRPREVHIVENAGDREMTVLGIFTPAGSPSAAYLEPHVSAEYPVSG